MINKSFNRRFFKTLAIGAFIAVGITTCSTQYLIGVNTTDSLPGTFYLVYRKEVPSKNDIIAFRAPKTRFYDERVFLKLVKGRAGDTVTWNGRKFMINGESMGIAKEHSLGGEPLEPSTGGTIGNNQFFAWTPHPDSFDSRYSDIGLIDSKRVLGRAVRLL